MLLGGRFSAPTVNDRTYQVIIYSLLYQIAKILNSIEFLIKTRLCFLPLSASLHRDTERILDFRQHEHTVQAAYAVYSPQLVQYEILVVLHAGYIYLHHEIKVSGYVIAFGYFFQALYGIDEVRSIFPVMLLQPYIAIYHYALAYFLIVQYG